MISGVGTGGEAVGGVDFDGDNVSDLLVPYNNSGR